MRQIGTLGSRARALGSVAVLALALGACATVPPAAQGPAPPPVSGARHDPFEGANRGLFALGRMLDRTFVRPIVSTYRRIVPGPGRRAVHNVVTNLDEPVVFVNDLLQLHPATAAKTAVRFTANTTVGVVGIFDAASTAGLPHHDNGFGSTLGHYGVGPGAYFYLPLLGPTTTRDAFGQAVDILFDPFTWTRFGGAETFGLVREGVTLLDEREQAEKDLRALENTAADPYATMRSVYFQSRQADIKGPDAALETLPELPPEPQSGPQPAPQSEPQSAPPAPPAPPEGAPPAAPQTAPAPPPEPPPSPEASSKPPGA